MRALAVAMLLLVSSSACTGDQARELPSFGLSPLENGGLAVKLFTCANSKPLRTDAIQIVPAVSGQSADPPILEYRTIRGSLELPAEFDLFVPPKGFVSTVAGPSSIGSLPEERLYVFIVFAGSTVISREDLRSHHQGEFTTHGQWFSSAAEAELAFCGSK